MVQEQVSGEVPSWLKTLPLAPEYHPTIQEFQDPISYIFKVEKEASKYGICKIVPPVPPQSKKVVVSNFNRSIAQRSSSPQTQNSKSQPTFTTRQQQIGFCPRKQRPVQKSVWQSGEHYTLQQFEAQAKNFERNYMKNKAKKAVSALEMETLYWKANGDRPFSVEYANDMPGSAFGPVKERRRRESGETGVGAGTVADTAWNMRGIARSNGSLLRFMKEEIPGVTSPMVYVAMMFSWFAWHVEDHDLHSVNYLHMGAGKTWYGVPRDAAAAFEEVIRVHGYGEEINPLVTFSVLGEKTTVMSPEVLISAGVPCCRLVQNAGEFVVTFPRAYHSGISHGFNVGEASNIATPEWLRFAKDAAIRRASINYPPMVSHFQLLYDLALALSSSNPSNASTLPRSSRLKDRKRGEGETLVKQLFVEDIIQNNNLLDTLGKGSAVVLLPQNPSERFICSNLRIGSRYNVKSGVPLRLPSSEEAVKSPKCVASDDLRTENQVDKRFKAYYSRKAKFAPMDQRVEFQSCVGSNKHTSRSNLHNSENIKEENTVVNGMPDRGLFSCVKCGIWPFACVAMVQPTESTSRYLMSTEFDINVLLALGELNDGFTDQYVCGFAPSFCSGSALKNASCGRCHVPVESAGRFEGTNHSTKSSDYEFEKVGEAFEGDSDAETKKSSALGLLALTYGNSSDSDEDEIPCHSAVHSSGDKDQNDHVVSPFSHQDRATGIDENRDPASLKLEDKDVTSHSVSDSYRDREFSRVDSDDSGCGSTELAGRFSNHNVMKKRAIPSSTVHVADTAEIINPSLPFLQKPDEDSSRIHVFCLEHAAELEQLLRPIGGVRVVLLCHPDYPKVQDAAKLVAKELVIEHKWNDTPFKVASKDDEEQIQMALHSEEETPKSGDWAVKLGINLYYSSVLCRSPLYSKQMPYNSVIYSLFGCRTPSASPKDEPKVRGKRSSRQRKVVMAGKWCGKVWMSNQVHPLLVNQETDGEEEDGIFPGSRLKNEEKILENSKPPRKAGISSKPRTATKRKSKFEDKSTKKMKSQDDEIAGSVDFGDSVDTFHHVGKRAIKKARYGDIEFAESDSGDSVDVGSHQKHKNVAKKTIKKTRTPDVEIEEDFEPEPLEEELKRRQGYARSIRSQRFKGQTRSYQPFNCHVAADRCDSSSESETEGGPSSRLRKRNSKPDGGLEKSKARKNVAAQGPKMRLPATKGPKMRFPTMTSLPTKGRTARVPVSKARAVKDATKKVPAKAKGKGEEYVCDIEGCNMSFRSEEDLSLHKRNICPVEDCYKKFFSHKYLVQHRRVHEDDRPLKCPWKGCKMTFKWAWARTEHIRVHTGARPYICKEPGCGQTFRFVSDFSRHKRKTGHSIRKKA